jgi:1,4-alpha-glucan branching enzyme
MSTESKVELNPNYRPARDQAEIESLVRGEHGDPFRVLGPHYQSIDGQERIVIRVFRPGAAKVRVLWKGQEIEAKWVHPQGLYVATLPAEAVGKKGAAAKAGTASAASAANATGASSAAVENADLKTHELPIGPADYTIRIEYPGSLAMVVHDAYAFPPALTDFDLHLMGEGTHFYRYEKLGAHVREIDGISGVHFAVWAPNARRVSVVGDFNRWDGRLHPLRNREAAGIWEIFLPHVRPGDLYKFEIISRTGELMALKADPYGFRGELRPANGSIVHDLDKYEWKDAAWMGERGKKQRLNEPLLIYEVHLGSWRRKTEEGYRWLTYRELADQLIPYAKWMGFTHLELLPIMEYPFDGSWGYQTVGYFAPTARYGDPDEFKYFVDRCHAEGLGVILDWTPAHFPRDPHGLAYFDGTHLYEYADPRRGEQPDWGTLVFNYGRNEVQNFLVSNALFWLDKYHIDGLRVDAVASMLYLDYSRKPGGWIPNQFGGRENLEAIAFLKKMNEVVHARHPDVLTIAEESTSWPAISRPTYLGGLGFDLKWNMGWMNDTLRYFGQDPLYRKYAHNSLTFSMVYAFSENFVLPLSHDEVVHGKRSLLSKMPGDDWQQFANLRLLYAYMWAHPGKKLLFMGGELAERPEWSETRSLDWDLEKSPPHCGVQRLVCDLNRLEKQEPALHKVDFDWPGFEWIEVNDMDGSTLSFMRRSSSEPGDFIVVVCNFTPVVHRNFRVGVPEDCFYEEILNSDSAHYEGSGVGNMGGVHSEPVGCNGKAHSICINLPPLGAVYLKPRRG